MEREEAREMEDRQVADECGRAWIDEREESGEGRPLWWRLKEPILS
jgi:hypothetical protein